MSLLSRFRITPAFVLALAALVLAVRGVAIGSVPAKSGVITACYAKHGGKMRIIDASKKGKAGKCRRSERKLTWNQKGVAGTPGTPGAPGAQGTVLTPVVRTKDFNSGPGGGNPGQLNLLCNPGEVALGGGIGWLASPSTDAVVYSGPVTAADDSFGQPGGTPIGWSGAATTSDMNKPGRLYVICAKP
jgi:hypothetical protein